MIELSELICEHPGLYSRLLFCSGSVIGGLLMLTLVYFLTKWKQEDEFNHDHKGEMWKEPENFSYPTKKN